MNMLIVLHIISALASIVLATVLFFAPSNFRFKLSYVLVASTITSGTFLIAANHTHLLQSCFTGLIYIMGVSTMLALAQYKYARQTNR